MMSAPRRVLASVAAWLVGAAASIGIGLLALSLIGNGLTDGAIQPLTEEAVAKAISTRPTVTATGVPAGSAGPTATPTTGHDSEHLLSSVGGTAVARCTDGSAYLVSWSPAQGYRTGKVVRGAAVEVLVVFENESGGTERKVMLFASCVDGVPQARVVQRVENDRH